MRVLMTGATGFLGRVVARRLREAGHTVRALTRAPDADLDSLGIDQPTGDLASLDAITAAAAGCEAAMHVAARVEPFAHVDDYYDTNVRGTDNVLAACEIAGVRKLVFTSCAGVVIDRGDLNGVNEAQRIPARAPTPYLATKALAERHVLAANGPQLATVALRPHLLWGPGESLLLPRLAALAKAGRLRLFGEAGKKIDSCYVDNAADAHLAALERLEAGAPIAGKAYFITQGEPATVEGFVNGLLRAAGYPAETRRVSAALARVLASTAPLRRVVARAEPLLTADALALFGQATWFNISAARRDLGYAPRVGMAEGLARVSAHLARERMRGR
ncbi:MAG TPA: NAD-dependent epimerase/dehydratase family protein [Rhodanobacteraceae bacterium]